MNEVIFNQLENLYQYMEGDKKSLTLHSLFIPLCQILHQGFENFDITDFTFDESEIPQEKYDIEDKRCVMLYSGGKCSLAMALMVSSEKYKLFHYGDLDISAIADELNAEYEIIPYKFNSNNPLYLLKLLGETLKSIIKSHLSPIIYVGTFEMSSIYHNPVDLWGNCIEIVEQANSLFSQIVPGFSVALPLPSYSYAWDMLLSNRGYMKYIVCADSTEQMILDIARNDWNIVECKNYTLYIMKLKKLLEEERGYKVKSAKELWKRYFFYDIRRSEYKAEIEKLLGE